jgi:hypothetical protein
VRLHLAAETFCRRSVMSMLNNTSAHDRRDFELQGNPHKFIVDCLMAAFGRRWRRPNHAAGRARGARAAATDPRELNRGHRGRSASGIG